MGLLSLTESVVPLLGTCCRILHWDRLLQETTVITEINEIVPGRMDLARLTARQAVLHIPLLGE